MISCPMFIMLFAIVIRTTMKSIPVSPVPLLKFFLCVFLPKLPQKPISYFKERHFNKCNSYRRRSKLAASTLKPTLTFTGQSWKGKNFADNSGGSPQKRGPFLKFEAFEEFSNLGVGVALDGNRMKILWTAINCLKFFRFQAACHKPHTMLAGISKGNWQMAGIVFTPRRISMAETDFIQT